MLLRVVSGVTPREALAASGPPCESDRVLPPYDPDSGPYPPNKCTPQGEFRLRLHGKNGWKTHVPKTVMSVSHSWSGSARWNCRPT